MPGPIIGALLGAGIEPLYNVVRDILDRIWPKQATEQEKAEVAMKMTEMLQTREDELLRVQRDILVAELAQGDVWTKRARPSVIYFGLFVIFIVHVAFPIVSWYSSNTMPPLSLPEPFWWAWTGIAGAWIVGRSFEKRGAETELIKLVTGSK